MVSNLTAENKGTITLYARWKKISFSDDSDNDTEVQSVQNTPDTLNQEASVSDEPTIDDAAYENTASEQMKSQEAEQTTTEPEESTESVTQEAITSE